MFKNTFDFTGRITRLDYLNSIILYIIAHLLILAINVSYNLGTLNSLFALLLFLFFIVQSIKRCHDLDRSGFWCLVMFIPFLNLILLVVLLIKNGSLGTNIYGPNPKDI